jgi:Ca2+-transporting ATPase
VKKISFENLKGLGGKGQGLSSSQVTAQQARFGKNEITEVAVHPLLELAIDTLKDSMIWFLLGVGIIFIFVGNTGEAIIVFAAILPLVFMDAILHWRTQASTRSLKGGLISKVTVLRNNRSILIDSRELVPGDLLEVKPGLFLPADGILEDASTLQLDESALTGEAFAVHKKSFDRNAFELSENPTVLVDPAMLTYAGTRVLSGTGTMRVLFTGKNTTYGEIVQSVAQLPHERTPLQKSLTQLLRYLIFAAAILCLVLAAVRIYQGHGWLDALLSAATLAIAAFPEEFPVVFTFFLGVGVYRLAKKRALVRRAVSVENIGRVTCICTDKTGTITAGVLQLTHLDAAGGLAEADLLQAAFAASDNNGTDPVDLAICQTAAAKALPVQRRAKTFPFTEVRKRETAVIQNSGGTYTAYLKGAPETVLAMSNFGDEQRKLWNEKTAAWARGGHKVLACARKNLNSGEVSAEPDSGFEFCGLLAFEDPLRSEVAGAMAYCEKNKIKVIMLTGDHVETALAIAKEAGLGGVAPVVVSAEDNSEKFSEAWLAENEGFLKGLDVIARCTPLQKLSIVNALKKAGELVAVTGDGVNDVPALKAADIGIAMGERGTRSAKEVASIILVDDNFRTIVGAIMEGRQLFTNLRQSFKYLLLIHMPFVLTAAAIPLMGYPLLYLPVHIVWLELIIHPSALFAFQQSANNSSAIFNGQKNFLSRNDLIIILLGGLAFTAVVGLFYLMGLKTDTGHARSSAMCLLTLWSGGLVAYFSKLKTKAAVAIAVCTFASSVILIQTPFPAKILMLSPLHFTDWLFAAGVTVLLLFGMRFLGSVLKHAARL